MMFARFMVVAVMLAPGLHWHKIKDTFKIHQVLEGQYGEVIGEYYQPPQPKYAQEEKFTVRCNEGTPQEVFTEIQAKQFVVACPR